MRLIATIVIITLVSSCRHGHTQFYHSYGDISKIRPDVEFLKENEQPVVYTSNPSRYRNDIYELESQGYERIGYSSFNGELENIKSVIAQAKIVKAKVAIAVSKYAGTQSSTIPLALPSTQTTYVNANVYGSGGNTYGQGTSTTVGTQYVPLTVNNDRYDQQAVYFVKGTVKYRLGVKWGELDNSQRLRLKRNTGALVRVVLKGTPAFRADILPGDLIIKINEQQVVDPLSFNELTKQFAEGETVNLNVLREGENLVFKVTLN